MLLVRGTSYSGPIVTRGLTFALADDPFALTGKTFVSDGETFVFPDNPLEISGKALHMQH